MADTPLVQQRYNTLRDSVAAPIFNDPVGAPAITQGIPARWNQSWWVQAKDAYFRQDVIHPPDINWNASKATEGYEEFADEILQTRSKPEADDLKLRIDRRRADDDIMARSDYGLLSDLIVGVADPVNLIPIPIVKGIGLVKGGLVAGAANMTLAAGTEVIQHRVNVGQTLDQSIANIGLAGLIGGGFGAVAGHVGSNRARAFRQLERGVSEADAPRFAMNFPDGEAGGLSVKGYREGMRVDTGRLDPDATGVRPRRGVVDELTGYAVKTVDGVDYISDDGVRWIVRADEGRPDAEAVGVDLAEHLGTPDPVYEKVFRYDELADKREFRDGRWHDEAAALLDDDVPIEQVVRNVDDFINLANIRHLWEERLPIRDGESVDDWKLRTGREAMREFRASKATGSYAKAAGLERLLEGLNFSPMVKAIKVFNGDNVVTETVLGLTGDSNVALKGAEYGYAVPPSAMLRAMQHTTRWLQFRTVLDAEWVKYNTAQLQTGRMFQGYNVTAARHASTAGARRAAGQNVLTYHDFNRMVGQAVFRKGEFEVNGFPVNDNARTAAKEYSRMMQEYDDILRSVGMFKDQKQLKGDIARLEKSRIYYEDSVNRWLWGQGATPVNYDYAVRVDTAAGPRIFTSSESRDDAVSRMIDELGDDGVELSETLTRANHGYWPKEDIAAIRADLERARASATQPDASFYGFDTAGKALDYIAASTADKSYGEIIRRIRSFVDDVPFEVLEPERGEPMLEGNRAIFRTLGADDSGRIQVRGEGYDNPGNRAEVVLHEALHAASFNRIRQGRAEGVSTPLGRAVDELDQLHNLLRDRLARDRAAGRPVFDYESSTLDEILAYGLTNREFQDWMKATPLGKTETVWSRFVTVMRQLLGIGEDQHDALSRLLEISDEILPGEGAPSIARVGEEARARFDVPGATLGQRDEFGAFTSMDRMERERVASLSPAQLEIYNKRRANLDKTIAEIAEAEADLKVITDTPHMFLDAAGNPEPYFARYFDHLAIGDNIEGFTRLIERWYERHRPEGARARAEDTVKRIMSDEAGGAASAGSTSVLNQRALSIPNSWTISDPELGEIAMADFIDTNALVTSEHYIKRTAARVEVARMFGDADLKAEKKRIREHLMQTYYEKQTTDEGRAAVEQRIEEQMDHIDIVHKALTNTLRTTSPMRWDNRAANLGRQFMNITSMGKILFTAIPEVIRPAMTQGFGTAFRSVLLRYLGDLDAIRANLSLNQASGDLAELAMLRGNIARVADDGEALIGNHKWDQWINDRVNGFFKMTGITSWTVAAKDLTMLAAQHNVMVESQLVADALKTGVKTDASETAAFRLRAMGIGDRDALLLATMPVQNHGKLVLPAIDGWTGHDGRLAREKLLRGITAEARRTIVTPSISDKASFLNGVWVVNGKVVQQSDLMGVPMQFMGYAMAAHNRVLTSAVQGRDRSTVSGLFWSLMLGIFANYLRTDEDQWNRKDYSQIVAEGFDASGVAGFWLGDINRQVERFTGNAVGIRPMLGIKAGYVDEKLTPGERAIGLLGPAPAKFYDISRAFWDNRISASDRAGIIRRGIPYNNLFYWERVFRHLYEVPWKATGAIQ